MLAQVLLISGFLAWITTEVSWGVQGTAVSLHTHTQACVCVCVYVCLRVYANMLVYVCLRVYVYVLVYVCLRVHVLTYECH
jgi:hypothetical protein